MLETKKKVKKKFSCHSRKRNVQLSRHSPGTPWLCWCFVFSEGSRQAQRMEAWSYFVLLPNYTKQLTNLLGRERDLWSTMTLCSAFLRHVFAAMCLGATSGTLSTYLLCAHSRHTLLPCGSRQRPREWATQLQIGKDRLGRSSLPNPGFSVLIKACWTRERLDSIWQCYPLYKRKCEEVNYIV